MVSWWDEWDIGNRTIGSCYGETVRVHNSMKSLLKGLREEPDGRRHQINLWQLDDFKKEHGLKPCGMFAMVRQVQYLVFLHAIARHLGYTPGRFTWFYNNIQIYDRHIDFAKELLEREPVDCEPKIWINPEKNDFYSFTQDDIKIIDYPRQKKQKIHKLH